MLMKTPDAMKASATSPEDEGVPVSVKIRERIQAARKRFHANDNIAAFVRDGELAELQVEVASKLHEVLRSLVIDTASNHNTH